jgi:hypothetical protein
MEIESLYRILDTTEDASDAQITSSYKRLALRYHPDRNPERLEWAHKKMSELNQAYRTLLDHRFSTRGREAPIRPSRSKEKKPSQKREVDRQELIDSFVSIREKAKDSLYKFFQYRLHRTSIRDMEENQPRFNFVVDRLRASYHGIQALSNMTSDSELIEHFDVFSEMIYNFYRSSECLDILDSIENLEEIEAYRYYRDGDEKLHLAQQELFFDRHNRGTFNREPIIRMMAEAQAVLEKGKHRFPDSNWIIETTIKLEYLQSLKKYLALFFTENA